MGIDLENGRFAQMLIPKVLRMVVPLHHAFRATYPVIKTTRGINARSISDIDIGIGEYKKPKPTQGTIMDRSHCVFL